MDVLLPFALILVAFYFLILRPQRSRARQAEQLQTRLAPGVEVMTTSGLFGRVTTIEDDTVHLEVSPGVTIKIVKAAVGRVVTEDGTTAAEHDVQAEASPADDTDEPGSPGGAAATGS